MRGALARRAPAPAPTASHSSSSQTPTLLLIFTLFFSFFAPYNNRPSFVDILGELERIRARYVLGGAGAGGPSSADGDGSGRGGARAGGAGADDAAAHFGGGGADSGPLVLGPAALAGAAGLFGALPGGCGVGVGAGAIGGSDGYGGVYDTLVSGAAPSLCATSGSCGSGHSLGACGACGGAGASGALSAGAVGSRWGLPAIEDVAHEGDDASAPLPPLRLPMAAAGQAFGRAGAGGAFGSGGAGAAAAAAALNTAAAAPAGAAADADARSFYYEDVHGGSSSSAFDGRPPALSGGAGAGANGSGSGASSGDFVVEVGDGGRRRAV